MSLDLGDLDSSKSSTNDLLDSRESNINSLDSAQNLGKSNKSNESNSADLWLNALKIALVNKQNKDALALLDKLPHFEKRDDLLCAKALVEELLESLKREKSALSKQMEKLKQTKRFLAD